MPAFTFEKIAPPAQNATPAQPKISPKTKPIGSRSLVTHMLDRLTATRLKRQGVTTKAGQKKT